MPLPGTGRCFACATLRRIRWGGRTTCSILPGSSSAAPSCFAGVAYSEIERQGVMLPVSNVEVEYTGGAGYDELVEVETRVSEVRSRTVSFAYVAKRAETGELLASGSTRLVCTNADGRPRRTPAAADRRWSG